MSATSITSAHPRQGSFRTRAKVAMAVHDLTVTAIAKQVGCSRVTASECINHSLHDPTRRKIAAFLNIEP